MRRSPLNLEPAEIHKGPREVTANSPLVNLALEGLSHCWLPQFQRWSHIYHLDGRNQPNKSVPHSEVFYTLNVLLGLSRVPEVPPGIQVRQTFFKNAQQLIALPVRDYAFGVALWTAAELGLELPDEVLQHCRRTVLDRRHWRNFHAQDLGMVLTGVVAQARREPEAWSPLAHQLFGFLSKNYASPSGLFLDTPVVFRRRFASFATQTYLTLACYAYGEFAEAQTAIDLANACTRKLMELQGPHGEWPWFFDPIKGIVVDPYEIYSVHQLGMAPAFLERAERHGIPQARHALIKGFHWALGDNQLAKSMILEHQGLTIRSQVRRGELNTKAKRAIRAVSNSGLSRSGRWAAPGAIEMRLECRSYELGSILWSFGGRTDLPQLTHDQIFCMPRVQANACVST